MEGRKPLPLARSASKRVSCQRQTRNAIEHNQSIDHNIHIQSKPQSSIYRVAQHFMLSLQPFSEFCCCCCYCFTMATHSHW